MTEVDRKYDYAVLLYNAMLKQSEDNLYKGKVVETFNTINISMSHYTPLFRILKELGSIELVERGVRNRDTVYRLHGEPTREAYDEMYLAGLTRPTRPATILLSELEKRVSQMEGRLKGVELKGILVNYEERISKLEKLEGGSKKIAKKS